MTLNASGPLSMGGSTVGQSINLELGVSATAQGALNDTSFRTLAGVATGQISISNFYGKSNAPPYFISAVSSQKSTMIGYYTVSSGNSYTVSTNTSNYILLTKYNSSGAHVWTKVITSGTTIYPSTSENAAVNEDSSGNTYFAFWSVTNNLSYVLKFNSSGTYVFDYQYTISGSANFGSYPGVCIDSSGNTTFVGINASGTIVLYILKVDSSGTLVSSKTYADGQWTSISGNNSPFLDSSGNIYLNAYFAFSGAGTQTLIKINSSGSVLNYYAVSLSTGTATNNQSRRNIVVNSSGDIYFLTKNSAYAGTVVKLNSSFVKQWAKSANVGSSAGCEYLSLGPSGGVMANVPFATNSYVAKPENFVYITSAGAIGYSRQLVATTSTNKAPLNVIGDGASTLSFINNTATGLQTFASKMPLDGSVYGGFQIDGAGGTTSAGNFTYQVLLGPGTVSSLSDYTSVVTVSALTAANISVGTTVGNRYASGLSISDLTLTLTTTNLTGVTNSSATYAYPGTYSFIVPTGVTSVSSVAVAGGAGGTSNTSGGGGALAYKNNTATTPGASISITVGAGGTPSNAGSTGNTAGQNSIGVGCEAGGGQTWSVNSSAGGTVVTGTGGSGGYGNQGLAGAGGAGGYAGSGGSGGYGAGTAGTAGAGGAGGGGLSGSGDCCGGSVSQAGGGVGLLGQGTNGPGGIYFDYYNGGSGGSSGYYAPGGSFGGGGGCGGYTVCCGKTTRLTGGVGGTGAVRIVWPGSTRSFPSTNVGVY